MSISPALGTAGLRTGVCTSTTNPTTPFNGQVIYETDTGKTKVYNGTAWVMLTNSNTPPGLELIKTTSATSGTYLDMLSVFSSTYTNYRVMVDNVSVTSGAYGLQIGLTTGTTPTLNGANWVWGAMRGDFATSAFNFTKETNSSYGGQIAVIGTDLSAGSAEIYRPNKTTWTHITFLGADPRGTSGYNPITGSGQLQDTTAYTGLRIYAGGGTFASITVSVYGYRN